MDKRFMTAVILLLGSSAAIAEPGRGIKAMDWTLIPYADFNMTYDSNIHQTRRDPEDDTFFDVETGLRFSRATGRTLPVFAGSLFFMRRMDAADSGDFDAFGDSLRVRKAGAGGGFFEVIHSFRRLDDVDQHANDFQNDGAAADIGTPSPDLIQDIHTVSQQRDVHQAGISAAYPLTDKLDASAAYSYSAVRFEDSQYHDLDGHIAQLESAYRLTEKTAAFVALREGLQSQEGLSESPTYTLVRGGAKSRGTDKIAYKAGVGLIRHSRPSSEDGHAPEITTELNYDVSVDWLATEKLVFRSGANNGIQMSAIYAGNALDYKSGWAGASWKPSETWNLSLRGSYRQDRYLDPVSADGLSRHRLDERVDIQCRVDYAACKGFLRIHAELFPWWTDSSIRELSYDEMRVMVGCSILY